MQTIFINQNDADQRLDKFLQKTFPSLPSSAMYKYIRKKRIKINHKRAEISTRLQEGDKVELYIGDDFLTQTPKDTSYQTLQYNLSIAYEDEHILMIEKPFGLVVHEDANEQTHTLINYIKAYLYQKREYRPEEEHSFTPALCNRIDRNTGGLVIAAKTAEGLRVMNQKIKDKEIEKKYLCILQGIPQKKEGTLIGYLTKDCDKNKVTVQSEPSEGAKKAVTKYQILEEKENCSLAEITLITGRTHQIRAHMASIGHPLLGDVKYGGKRMQDAYQALYSYRLTFRFTTPAGKLDHLNGKTVIAADARKALGWELL